jgi:hypothetical protein
LKKEEEEIRAVTGKKEKDEHNEGPFSTKEMCQIF